MAGQGNIWISLILLQRGRAHPLGAYPKTSLDHGFLKAQKLKYF